MDRLAKAQQSAVTQARRELRKVFETVYNMYDDPADMRDALLDLVPAIAAKYGDAGSVAAGEWYEQMRAKWFKDAIDIDTTYQPDDKAMRETIRRLAGHLWDGKDGSPADPDAMLRGLLANMDKWVKAGGRGVIEKAARRDPRKPRYARVPQGAKTCAFCGMLAGRGFVYSSAEAAGAMSQYHKDCDCEVIPSWDKKNPKVQGYDDSRFEKRYMEARRMLEDGTVPEELRYGLLKIKPYLEPKHRKSWYGPADPNNVNSITYLMRHLHPDEFTDLILETPDFLFKDGRAKKALGDDAAKSLDGILRNSAHQSTAKLWAQYSDRYVIKSSTLGKGGRAHYSKTEGGIFVDIDSVGKPSRGHGPYGVFIHESAHMLDDLLGDGSSGYCVTYRGGIFPKTLADEGTSLFYRRVEMVEADSYPERFSKAMESIAEEFWDIGGDDSLNLHDMMIASLQSVNTSLAET
ncbi:phage protein [Bifidobacterium leontopitheci]|uniref:Phage protein n=1 Tax=Bifidobacterium leontopitheci TaxID=2650774 RepID=A0A6I1GGI8_9BIFI|nr:phage protein [Bifidobacterium leontopitheci]